MDGLLEKFAYIFGSGCEELIYMSNEFGGYWGNEGQAGYGIAVFNRPGKSSYIADKWYRMS